MRTLVFFLEEPSAGEMLKGVLPKVLPRDIYPEYKVFEGKQDLEKQLPGVLRAWKRPGCDFVVMRDQDSGDCHAVKRKLLELCQRAGKGDALIRVACRELESFYLGDLAAVEQGLGLNGLSAKQNNRKYRNPDNLGNPFGELTKLTEGEYQKVAGSRAIGKHLDLANNRSHSFNVLLTGIRRLLEAA